LRRISLVFTLLFLSALQLVAQSGGYSYLEFVQNKGQWDSSILYRADLDAGAVFIQKKGFMILQQDTADLRRIHGLLHGEKQAGVAKHAGKPGSGNADDPFLLHSHIYHVEFENANDNVQIEAEKRQEYTHNYMAKGKASTGCGIFLGVVYKNLYDGIDLHYYTEGGFVKYNLIVHPGADPSKISLHYVGLGPKDLLLKKNQVSVRTSVGTVKELEPKTYQAGEQGRVEVPCKYQLREGNRLRFQVDNYDHNTTLVIDPTEVFCSFTGSHSDNWGYTATYDNAGELILGGIVLDYASVPGTNFGATAGAFQSTYQGGDGSEGIVSQRGGGTFSYNYDIGLMKFNAAGTRRVWATYLGGSGDEQPHSLVCDAEGNVIITGRTSSTAFPPVTLPTFGPCGGLDIFVAKLSADGTKLLGAMKIGGKGQDGVNNSPKYVNEFGDGTQELRLNYGDDGRSEVILDAANNVYVASSTRSPDFPVTGGVFQPSYGGGTQDGVLLKLSPDLKTVLFSSFMGGDDIDAAFVLAQHPTTGNIYVAGGTRSKNLQGISAGPVYRGANDGSIDGFISIVSPDGKTLVKSTYFGVDGQTDMIYGISFDKYGFPYITGTSNGFIPTQNSPFNSNNNQIKGHQFITKLQPDLSSIVYSTNFGPESQFPNISPTAFLVDRCQNVYVSGWGGGIDIDESYNNSGTNGLPTTPDAIRTSTDNADFYFFVLKRDAVSQLYGSFFGQVEATDKSGRQSLGDHVDGGTSRFDAQGVIYEAICANCGGIASFPVTAAAPFRTNPVASSGLCNEAAVKIQFNFAGVAAGLKVVTHGRGDSVGCLPLNATFSDTIRNAKSYTWDFGDGTVISNTTDFTENHTYNAVGKYRVMLIAMDPNSCNEADTAIKYVYVEDNPAFLDFRYDKIGPCESFQYVFTNLSTKSPNAPPFSDTAFTWSFGDGTVLPDQNLTGKPSHTYQNPGPYKVTLSLVDTSYCNAPMDSTRLLYVTANDTARFTTPQFGCAPYNAVFNNVSIGGQKFYWDFGDGSGIDSVDYSPMHLYTNIGNYTVTLTAIDSTTCNIISTSSYQITVQGKPTVDFTYTPASPQPPNTPTVFTDASSPGVKYEWFFGDGSSEVKTTPDTVVHQYNKTDTYEVCEVVTNASGCTDTACHSVSALINPLLDVPNAFTPGRFGQNAVVKVVGFGIVHMTWRIFNRWGQVVFESVNPYLGWDGMYHGVPQPMDVYAYTLEAEFSDGTHATKKGDITLIR
jgi:gliding motility-associated-like protein